jgi:hypothetical protein
MHLVQRVKAPSARLPASRGPERGHTLLNRMLAISDTLLAAFSALRDKFRKLITGLRSAAVAGVNKVATFLEVEITKLLDLLGRCCPRCSTWLERRLLSAIKSVESKIQGAL